MSIRFAFLWFALLLVLSGVVTLYAQDDSQLHTVTGDEFLRAIPDLIDALPEDTLDSVLIDTLTVERQLRDLEIETITPEEAQEAYYAMLNVSGLLDGRDVFIQPILQALINDRQIQLDPVETTTTQFHDFIIEAQPRDFNADGQPEWVLDVDEADITQMMAAVENVGGTVQFVDAPLPWFGCCFTYWVERSGFMEEQRFEDLTGDGVPEWVLAVGGIGGNHMWRGWLIILQWRDGQLVDVTPQIQTTDFDHRLAYEASAGGCELQLFPCGVEVTYDDVDANGTTEIIITQDYVDNWDCELTERRVFTWRDNTFQLEEQTWDYPDSAGCALRLAQDAMWEHDYESAIPLFEHSIALFDDLAADEQNSNTRMLRTYAGVRLALAYSLAGRTEEAVNLLSGLEMPEDAFVPPDLVPIAQQAINRSAMDLCVSLYVTFDDYFHSGIDVNRYLGVTYNIPVPVGGFGAPENRPENAGCDIQALLGDLLSAQPLTASESPVDRLEMDGIPVTQTLSADFNGDAQDDWVVWLHPGMEPLFFASQNDELVWSFVNYANIADEYTTFSTIDLPEEAGRALVAVRYREDEPLPDGAGGPFATCVTRDGDEFDTMNFSANVRLWRYEGEQLQYIQWLPLCERLTVEDIFSDDTLFAWQNVGEWTDERRLPTTYIWQPERMRYVLPEDFEEPTERERLQESQDSYVYIDGLTYISGMLSYDLADSLERVNATIDNYNENYNVADYQLYYLRGLVNELLGNTDAALADYRYVYENAPDEVWRMLASLHIA